MNVTSGYLLIITAGIITAWHLTAAIHRRLRTRYIQRMTDAQANEEWLRAHVFHPGMSVPDLDMPHGMWPTCSTPPCDWEDDFRCCAHQPAVERIGRHRAVWGSLDGEDAAIILQVITDCENKRQP